MLVFGAAAVLPHVGSVCRRCGRDGRSRTPLSMCSGDLRRHTVGGSISQRAVPIEGADLMNPVAAETFEEALQSGQHTRSGLRRHLQCITGKPRSEPKIVPSSGTPGRCGVVCRRSGASESLRMQGRVSTVLGKFLHKLCKSCKRPIPASWAGVAQTSLFALVSEGCLGRRPGRFADLHHVGPCQEGA